MSARTIYVRWSDDGQNIRKWSWSEFDLAERLIAESVSVSDPKAEAMADALREAIQEVAATERCVTDAATGREMRDLIGKWAITLAAWEAMAAREHAWSTGDTVLWPNGVEGKVCGVDFDDFTIMDECGGWFAMADCDLLGAGS